MNVTAKRVVQIGPVSAMSLADLKDFIALCTLNGMDDGTLRLSADDRGYFTMIAEAPDMEQIVNLRATRA